MKSIHVKVGEFEYIIYLQHIISISTSTDPNRTFIRVTNGESLLVNGTFQHVENEIRRESGLQEIK